MTITISTSADSGTAMSGGAVALQEKTKKKRSSENGYIRY
jgi:hypothetical protein